MTTYKGMDGAVKAAAVGNQPGLVGEIKTFEFSTQSNIVEDTAMGSADRSFKSFQDSFNASIEAHWDADDAGQAVIKEGDTIDLVLYPNYHGASPAPANQIECTALVDSVSINTELEAIVAVTFTCTGTAAVIRGPQLFFNGSSTQVNIIDAAGQIDGISNGRIGAIIKPDKNNTTEDLIVVDIENATGDKFYMYVLNGLVAIVFDTTGDEIFTQSIRRINDGSFHTISFVFSPGSNQLLIDGVVEELYYFEGSSSSSAIMPLNSTVARIGLRAGFLYFDGIIADVVFEDTSVEVANWPLDDGFGTTAGELVDSNDGVITAPVWL